MSNVHQEGSMVIDMKSPSVDFTFFMGTVTMIPLASTLWLSLPRYSHRPMKDLPELHRFFRDNEGYLADMYRKERLGKYTFHFHEYLRKKSQTDPDMLDKWDLKLRFPAPDPISLSELLGLAQPPSTEMVTSKGHRDLQHSHHSQDLSNKGMNGQRPNTVTSSKEPAVPSIIGVNGLLPSLDSVNQVMMNLQVQNPLPHALSLGNMIQYPNNLGIMPNPHFTLPQLNHSWLNPQLLVNQNGAQNSNQFQPLMMMAPSAQMQGLGSLWSHPSSSTP